jgi:serine/threonine protein phosphatase 1
VRTFVIGDIHGAYQAFVQCLERSHFERDQDRLIVLGDVCDVYPQVKQCVDEMLGLKNLDYVIGNHDLWAINWAQTGVKSKVWMENGGQATIDSYGGVSMPKEHLNFFNKAKLFLEAEHCLFVHAGFNPVLPLKEQGVKVLAWDRELVSQAYKAHREGQKKQFTQYEQIFVGHTPTVNFGSDIPLQLGNLWMLDTGAGWSKKLSIMDFETKEFWQSDPTQELYGSTGRF